MENLRLILVCCCVLEVVQVVRPFTMDEIISSAAENTSDFAFFQGDGKISSVRVELDMIFSSEQWTQIQKDSGTYGDEHGREKRKAIRSAVYRWPNGVIPYEFAAGVFTNPQRQEIERALNEWKTYTCLQFRRATYADRDKIRFDNGGGCYSNVGKVGGAQTVGLATGCRYKGVVVHEVGHAVGFQHEQTRPDRDDHVQIIRQNIPPHLYYNFQKYSTRSVNNYDVPYDYMSIMHYGPKAFSVNGGLTIKTRDPKYQNVIGNRQGMSFRDIKTANSMYQCNAACRNRNQRCPGEGFVDKNCRCMCPGNPIRECSGGSTDRTTLSSRTTTSSGTGTNECVDRHKSCSAWASRGECENYKAFMSSYCKKSCEICVEEKNSCKDMSEHCAYWQKQGYCRFRYVTYMRSNCAKSCDSCGSVDNEMFGTTTVSEHVDRSGSGQTEEDANSGVTSRWGTVYLMPLVLLTALLM